VERGHALWFEPRSVCGLEMIESQVNFPSSISKRTAEMSLVLVKETTFF
jgi:hypothetical protein